jgi:thiamine biosynthesis protein ThiI
MEVINNVTNIPVIRPVACLDKLEIISISEKIDTYNISILPYEDCCTVFVPRHPVINPSLEKSINEENKINYDELIDKAIDNILTISLNEKPNEYEGLL